MATQVIADEELERLRGFPQIGRDELARFTPQISRQLNKGESAHALERDLLYAHEGAIRARHLEAQAERAWCLTPATNAVVAWTTEYHGLAVESMRAAGRRIDDVVLAHISPAHREDINFLGAIDVDIEGELAQLGSIGARTRRRGMAPLLVEVVSLYQAGRAITGRARACRRVGGTG